MAAESHVRITDSSCSHHAELVRAGRNKGAYCGADVMTTFVSLRGRARTSRRHLRCTRPRQRTMRPIVVLQDAMRGAVEIVELAAVDGPPAYRADQQYQQQR